MKRSLTKDELFEMLEKYGTVDREYNEFRGESWTISGKMYGYSGGVRCIDGESPRKFVEFHKFLKENFPNITYMEYLEIEDNCVHTDTKYERDYYTERTVEYWVADIDKLLEYLPEIMDYDYEMTCKHCGTTFRFNKEDIDNVEGGLMGDWDGVWCPGCKGYVETYPKNRIKLHE
jgi:hypothetical protein